MNDKLIKEEKKGLSHFEQYILSILVAVFIYGITLFCLSYIAEIINPYFDFSEDTIKIAQDLKELFLLDRNFKYLFPLIIYLFFFGLSMQSLYGLTNRDDS
tara:strand:+ start:108 stop:410 length:303 start_codon:yes stop_codon:yes gene_type:complete